MIIAKAALYALSQIFQPNLLYKKAGVIVSGITSDVAIQGNLFVQHDNEKLSSISQVSDYLNTRYGKGTVQLAIQGSGREWRLKQEKLSPGYTTKWNDILDVKA
jgi:DNA polymerase V